MSLRDLDHTSSTDTLWEELVYTDAQLEADPRTRKHARAVAQLLTQLGAVRDAQQQCWRDELVAQAQVDRLDAELDDRVEQIADDLLSAVDKDRDHPRFVRYLREAPSELLRLGLESELARVRTWPEALAHEPEKALQAHAKPLAKLIEAGDAALAERTRAAGATATNRVRGLVRLVDDINGLRLSLYNALLAIAIAQRLDKAWPERFFRKNYRSTARKRERDTPAPAPAPKPAG